MSRLLLIPLRRFDPRAELSPAGLSKGRGEKQADFL